MFRKYVIGSWIVFAIVLALFTTIGCEPSVSIPPDPGTTTEVPTTIQPDNVIGPSGGDDTERLQNAINANNITYITGTLVIDKILDIRSSNKTIIFQTNAKLKRSVLINPDKPSDTVTFPVMKLVGSKNIIIQNLTIDGADNFCKYNPSRENQNGISLEGVDNITINGGSITNTPGDGVYITNQYPLNIESKNIKINNLNIKCSGRNSISNIHSQYVNINNGNYSNAGLWIFNIEPYNALSVKDYSIYSPTIGFSGSNWLWATGPSFSCKVERVLIDKPKFAVTKTEPVLKPCISGAIVINY